MANNNNRPISVETASAAAAVAVTPSDSTQLQRTRGLYVGTAGGDLSVVMALTTDGEAGSASGSTVTIPNAPVGYHPLQVIMVLSTGTGVTNIVALY